MSTTRRVCPWAKKEASDVQVLRHLLGAWSGVRLAALVAGAWREASRCRDTGCGGELSAERPRLLQVGLGVQVWLCPPQQRRRGRWGEGGGGDPWAPLVLISAQRALRRRAIRPAFSGTLPRSLWLSAAAADRLMNQVFAAGTIMR